MGFLIDHGVHDRKKTAVFVVFDLGALGFREKQGHSRIRIADRRQCFRIKRRFEFAVQQHLVDIFAVRHTVHASSNPAGSNGISFFFLAPPFDGFQIDAVMVLQDAAHPQSGRVLQSVQRHSLAVEIGRLFDAATGSL